MALSLRLKLFILLTLLPIIALSLYLGLAKRLFEEDKIAYVYDSSSAIAKSMAAQVKSELTSIRYSMAPYLAVYSSDVEKFNQNARDAFNKQDSLEGIFIFKIQDGGSLVPAGSLLKTGVLTPEKLAALQSQLQNLELAKEFVQKSKEQIFLHFMGEAQDANALAVIGLKFGETEPGKTGLAMALFSPEAFKKPFEGGSGYSNFLVDGTGKVIAGTEDPSFSVNDIFRPIQAKDQADATETIELPNHSEALVSYSRTSLGNLTVLSVIGKRAALKAVDILLAKSIIFFIALIAITILLSVISSKTLTSALTSLYQATTQIAEGKFDEVRVEVKSRDEIGELAKRFNQMAQEVSTLMKSNIDRVRMEDELKTAKLVQETLFPAVYADLGPVEISGYYEPASECGGDWWYYCEIAGKYFFWIGDATGHGVPAALITSAARSSACMIESFGNQDLGPGKVLSLMNRAIVDTSKGQLNMSFFVGCFDPKRGKFSYSNGGHPPPYFITRAVGADGKTEVTMKPLQEASSSVLGYDIAAVFPEAEFDVTPGTSVILFTDGLLDVVSPAGESYGRKRARNLFKETCAVATKTEDMLNVITSDLGKFRGQSALVDDLTFFVVTFKSPTASTIKAPSQLPGQELPTQVI